MNISIIKLRESMDKLIKGLIMFLFIFEIIPINVPTLFSSRKITLMCLILMYLFKKPRKKFPKNYNNYFFGIIVVNLVILVWLMVLSIAWPDVESANYVFSRELYFLIYTIIGSVLLFHIFHSIEDFFKAIVIAMVIQSSIVYGQFLFQEVRLFLDSSFVNAGNISYFRTDRANGLGAEGANLSLLLASGIYCICYFSFFRNVNSTKYIITIMYLLGASMLTGRTGFYIAICYAVAAILFISFKQFGKGLFKVLAIFLIFSLILPYIIDKLGIEKSRIESINDWAMSLFENGLQERTITAIANMGIPKITNETIVGTGIYRGTTSLGTVIQHDGGYIQMYASLGLIFTIIFYISLFYFVILLISKIKNKYLKTFFTSYLLVIVIVEIKEPFIFKYIIPLILITSLLLLPIEESKNKNNHVRVNY